MIIGTPPDRYDRNWFSRAFDRLAIDLRARYSRQQDLIIDGNSLILTAPNKTQYRITIDNSGTLTTTQL